jgi:hypothetical protein
MHAAVQMTCRGSHGRAWVEDFCLGLFMNPRVSGGGTALCVRPKSINDLLRSRAVYRDLGSVIEMIFIGYEVGTLGRVCAPSRGS